MKYDRKYIGTGFRDFKGSNCRVIDDPRNNGNLLIEFEGGLMRRVRRHTVVRIKAGK